MNSLQTNILIIITINLLIIEKSISKMEDFVIDVNDILSENLMPTSFFLIDSDNKNSFNRSKFNENSQNIFNASQSKDQGTFGEAFSTMGFHRYTIQYLKKSFNGFSYNNSIFST